MDTIIGIGLFITGFIFGYVVFRISQKKDDEKLDRIQNQLKETFGNLSREALSENIDTFYKLSENKFGELLKSSDGQLEEKKKLIDSSLEEMKKQLKGLNKQTTELPGQMVESKKGITELADTTTQLRQILSSSQARGQWGERMVEDILSFIGLTEGINYEKQSQEGSDRPDFKFNLPDGKHINMDVKFPLSHYENFLASENDTEQ